MNAERPAPVVRARDLSVHYQANDVRSRTLAIDGATFDVAPGEVLGVVGESGSGKSTLARAVALQLGRLAGRRGLPTVCGGSLRVLGYEARRMTPYRADRLRLRIGYLAQDSADQLDPRMSVAENVASPIYSRDRKYSSREAGSVVATLIDSVRLPLSVMHRHPHELSSGQKQRVALAKALVLGPDLFVADEPTRGVDVLVRDSVLDVIGELRAEHGFAAIVVSSDLQVVERLTQRILVLSRGVIVGAGEIDDVLARPYHPYVRRMRESLGEDAHA